MICGFNVKMTIEEFNDKDKKKSLQDNKSASQQDLFVLSLIVLWSCSLKKTEPYDSVFFSKA